MTDPQHQSITAIDLFCGAGGFSEGLSQAADELGFDLHEAAVNHWDQAVATHERNHPDAHQYQSKVEQLHPPEVARKLGETDDVDVDLLVGGPSCTHFSRARGGKPVNEQLRMSPWHVLDWLEKLNVDAFVIENVPEICFPEDSMVLTEDGPVPIQDVEVGTRVLTHKGRWKEVTNKTSRTGDTVKIESTGNRLVRCTPDHEFYARQLGADTWGGKGGRHVQQKAEAEWVAAEDLAPEADSTYGEKYDGYQWATPQEFGASELTVPELPTDRVDAGATEFWRMIGIWLGDGWFYKRTSRSDPPHGLRIAGQDPKLEEQLAAVGDLSWNKQVRKSTDTYVYETSCKALAHWINKEFGEYAHGKTVPAWTLALPEKHRRAIVEGYQQADGSTDPSGRGNATTVSKQLALGVKFLLESLDVSASLSAPVTPSAEEESTKYTLTWDWDLCHEDNNLTDADGTHRWTRVTDVEEHESETTVYDLTVADDHSFVVDGVVAHNCSWGPVDDDGQPVRDGSIFDAWVNALNSLGYAVEWTQLVAADYGDPTTRERFFIVGRQHGSVTFPDPTHSDDDPELPDYRTAADIIDWSDLGESIWTRDLTKKRVHSPPKDSTMQRIAEGIRRHCGDVLEPFADALAELGRDEIRHLREDRVVPSRFAGVAAEALDAPFLVSLSDADEHADEPILLRQQDGAHPCSTNGRPVPTIATKGAHAIATPSLVMPKNFPQRGLHSNPLYSADDRPLHTVTADPRAKLVTPYLAPLYNPRPKQRPRTRGIDRPLMTVPASKSPAALTAPSLLRWSHGGATLDLDAPMPTIATEKGGVFSLSQPVVRPFIDDYEGPAKDIGQPLGTVTSKDRFALCVPELWPWGLDVRYRMLQPAELKQAQGFPADYEITGTKTDRTEQIGNAVPVHLAKALCKHVLTAEDPSLASFGGGISADGDADIPDYEDVATDGGQR